MGKNNVALTRRGTNALMRRTEPVNSYVTPVADIYETGDAYVVKLDLPGATQEAINLSVEPNLLTVRATLHSLVPATAQMVLQEIGRKSYFREFRLGEGIDTAKIHAEFEDGVLTITLPKVESLRAKEIRIQ
jgi:HSP20 family protein